MGMWSDERANGVAVSFDPIRGYSSYYYLNTQLGEDLVTNPDALSEPEEILLHRSGDFYEVLATSNQVTPGTLLMSDEQMDQLAEHLTSRAATASRTASSSSMSATARPAASGPTAAPSGSATVARRSCSRTTWRRASASPSATATGLTALLAHRPDAARPGRLHGLPEHPPGGCPQAGREPSRPHMVEMKLPASSPVSGPLRLDVDGHHEVPRDGIPTGGPRSSVGSNPGLSFGVGSEACRPLRAQTCHGLGLP